jgi:hypothetical protein
MVAVRWDVRWVGPPKAGQKTRLSASTSSYRSSSTPTTTTLSLPLDSPRPQSPTAAPPSRIKESASPLPSRFPRSSASSRRLDSHSITRGPPRHLPSPSHPLSSPPTMSFKAHDRECSPARQRWRPWAAAACRTPYQHPGLPLSHRASSARGPDCADPSVQADPHPDGRAQRARVLACD